MYPVVSRRARGVSIGVNLNPDKICNFSCIYCQVNRREPGEKLFVDISRLRDELRQAVHLAQTGEIFQFPRFADTPQALRRLNDIAFSGDGEPTTFTNFEAVVQVAAEVRQAAGLPELKLILISNASMFHRPAVQKGLAILDKNNGEIWAKLDAGTEGYFAKVNRAGIPFSRILDNITQVSQIRPIVIQSLFMQINSQPPPEAEIQAYCARLKEIVSRRGQIKLVQVYTVARPPAESFVTPLPADRLQALAQTIAQQTQLPVEAFP